MNSGRKDQDQDAIRRQAEEIRKKQEEQRRKEAMEMDKLLNAYKAANTNNASTTTNNPVQVNMTQPRPISTPPSAQGMQAASNFIPITRPTVSTSYSIPTKIATPAATPTQPVSTLSTSTTPQPPTKMTLVEQLRLQKKPIQITPPNNPDPVAEALKKLKERGLLRNQNESVSTPSPVIIPPPRDRVAEELERVLGLRTQNPSVTSTISTSTPLGTGSSHTEPMQVSRGPNQKRPIEVIDLEDESPAPKKNKTSDTTQSSTTSSTTNIPAPTARTSSSLPRGLIANKKYDITGQVNEVFKNIKDKDGKEIIKDKNGENIKVTMMFFEPTDLHRRTLIQKTIRASVKSQKNDPLKGKEAKEFISKKKYSAETFDGEFGDESYQINVLFFQERFVGSDYRGQNASLNDTAEKLPEEYQTQLVATLQEEAKTPEKKNTLCKTLQDVLQPQRTFIKDRKSQPKPVKHKKLLCSNPDGSEVIEEEIIQEYSTDKSSNGVTTFKKYDITDEVKEFFPENNSKVTIIFLDNNWESDHTKVNDVILDKIENIKENTTDTTDKDVKRLIQQSNHKPCVKFRGELSGHKIRAVIFYETVLEARNSQYQDLNQTPEKLPPHVSQMLKDTLSNDRKEKRLRDQGLPVEPTWKKLPQNLYHKIDTQLIHLQPKNNQDKAEASIDADGLEESDNEKSSPTTAASIVQPGTLFGRSGQEQVPTATPMSMDGGKDEVPIQKRQ